MASLQEKPLIVMLCRKGLPHFKTEVKLSLPRCTKPLHLQSLANFAENSHSQEISAARTKFLRIIIRGVPYRGVQVWIRIRCIQARFDTYQIAFSI